MSRKLKSLGTFWNQPRHAAYLFLLPALIILLVFTVIPVIATFVIGFFNMNIFFNDTTFAGFDNFIRVFQDERALNSLWNTFRFTLLQTPLQISVGLVIAALLSKTTLFNKFCSSVFFIPVVCSFASVGIIWSMLLDANIGVVPNFLAQLGLGRISFFRDANFAMPTIAIMTTWKNFGITMTILLAAIRAVSSSLYESAYMDGATKMQQFFYITIPQIIPALGFCMLTNFISSMNVFDQVFVTTQGGPNFRTETAVMYIYSRGFSSSFELGYASAISAILFVVIAVLSLLLNGYMSRKESQMK